MRRFRKRVRVTFATHNVGNAPAERVLANLAGIDIIGFQEFGDRWHDLGALLLANGWKCITGDQPGQDSVPVFYRPDRVTLRRAIRVLLEDTQNVGPGAGPDVMKAKWLMGGRFACGPRRIRPRPRVTFRNLHSVATQNPDHPKRLAVAKRIAEKTADASAHGRRAVTVGDFNAEPDTRQLAPMRRLMQLASRVATHGNRYIDLIWFRFPHRDQMRVVAQGTRNTGSDHRLHYITLEF